jgi:hypothetical protein
MNLNALHRRLLQEVQQIGNPFPPVIYGGLCGSGTRSVIGVDAVPARFMVTNPGTSEDCEVDILKGGPQLCDELYLSMRYISVQSHYQSMALDYKHLAQCDACYDTTDLAAAPAAQPRTSSVS